MPRAASFVSVLPLLGALAGCGEHEPYARAGAWRPLGANADNLRAMVANPADLYAGRGAATGDGTLAALAVGRLQADQVKPLPNSAVTEVKANDAGSPGQQGPGQQGPGGAAAAAAGDGGATSP